MIWAFWSSVALLAATVFLWRRAAGARDAALVRWRNSEGLALAVRNDASRLEAGLSGSTEGLIVLDEQGHVVASNRAAQQLTDLSAQDFRGARIDQLVPWTQLHEAVAQCRLDGMEQAFEIELALDEDHPRTLAVRVLRLPGLGAVVGIVDQSRIKRLESLRREFVANVSHELKTPLAAIQGFIETMQDDLEMPAETRTRFLDRVATQSKRLATLVSDLLTISRLDDEVSVGREDAVDVVALLTEIVSDLAPLAEKREIDLSTQLPESEAWVRADREGLRQAAGNLVDNALKYTPERGAVTVTLKHLEGERLRLEVADTGIGLSAENQRRIFERFYRVDSARSRELGGTGLGLSIVKNTIQNLGGDIGVKSELGVGSLFWLELPTQGDGESPAPDQAG